MSLESYKKQLVLQNEREYGAEVRVKYGDEAMDASNDKIVGMSEDQWQKTQDLSAEINKLLKSAMTIGDVSSDTARMLCEKHALWLKMFWKEGSYSKQAHMALAESYVADQRFRAYYEKIAPGAAEFLRDAMEVYTRE